MISILMPLYNGAEFLDDSITSVLRQSYKEWELLIGVNGHPQDKQEEIVEKIHSFNCDKIRVITSPVKSKTTTLNILAGEAYYGYICLLDADDYWFPEKLKKQLPFIERYDVVGSDAAYFGNKLGTPNLFLGEIIPDMFICQNPIMNSAAMLKKECAWWSNEWEGLDDYNLWIHLMRQGKTFFNVPEILINHRVHGASHYNGVNEEMHQKLMERLPKLNEERSAEMWAITEGKAWRT